MLQSEVEIQVRYVETDKMGFVHHAHYLPWLELARVRMMDDLGYPYREMEADGVGLPLTGAQLRYLRPAYFDDRLRIETLIRKRPAARMVVDYRIHRGDELLTEATTEHFFMDQQGKPCRPNARFLEILDRFFPVNRTAT